MTEYGKNSFVILSTKKGTGSLNGKTFSFQAYDKKKKKWVNLGKKKN